MSMRKFKLIGLFFIAIVLPSSLFAEPVVINQVVAVVNNDAITSSQISRQLALIKYRVRKQGKEKELPPDNILRNQILQQLINRSLQLQVAKQGGIQVSSTQISQALSRIAKQNHISVRTLYARMKKNGFTVKQFRNEISDEITIQMLEGREVASRINISQSEIDDILKRLKQQTVEYNLGDILITVPAVPTAPEIAKAKAKAQMILNKLNKGAKFSHLAMAYSQASTALKGGNMGWRKLAELPAVFADHVISMNPGEVSGPIRAANGFHLLKLYGLRNVKLPKKSQMQRKQVENLLFQERFQQQLVTWLQQLRAEAYIKIY